MGTATSADSDRYHVPARVTEPLDEHGQVGRLVLHVCRLGIIVVTCAVIVYYLLYVVRGKTFFKLFIYLLLCQICIDYEWHEFDLSESFKRYVPVFFMPLLTFFRFIRLINRYFSITTFSGK